MSSLVSLGFAEACARLYARMSDAPLALEIRSRDPFAVKIEPHGEIGYRQRPGAVFYYPFGKRATANAQGWRGPVVPVPKPAGIIRIVLLGESTTHGWGVNDDETIDAHLRTVLAARYPDRRFDVVNLAYDGYDSWQVFERLRTEADRVTPDLLVLNTGVNDVRSARYAGLRDKDPRTLLWEGEIRRLRAEHAQGGPTLWTRLKHRSFAARAPGAVRQVLRSGRARAERVSEKTHPEAAAYFERNIRRTLALARERQLPVLLSTPPSVLLDPRAPPDMTPRNYWVVDRATTQAYRDTLEARLRAIAVERAALGEPVAYVGHALDPSQFLDDCHLTSEGNRQLAEDFVAAIGPFLPR